MAKATSLTGRGEANSYDNIAASTTDSVLVAAPSTGLRILVTSLVINQGDTTPSTVTFNSKGSGAGTAIYPVLKAAANGGFVLPYNQNGYFATNKGEALTVTTGAGSATSVAVKYALVSS